MNKSLEMVRGFLASQLNYIPALFVIFQAIQEKITPIKWDDTDNKGIESEIEQYSRK